MGKKLNFFFFSLDSTQTGSIEGKKDIVGGRSNEDKITAKSSAAGKYFNSLSYTADGRCVLAGSNSKYVCIYETKEKILLKRFVITGNRSLDGVVDFLNSKNMTEAGPLDLIDDESDEDEVRESLKASKRSLPGVASGSIFLFSFFLSPSSLRVRLNRSLVFRIFQEKGGSLGPD